MIDFKGRHNLYHTLFRNKQEAADLCHYVWIRLLNHIRPQEPWIDAVIWEIGATVNVRPACTAFDESHRSFIRPFPIYFQLPDYKEEKQKVKRQKGVDSGTIEKELLGLERELLERMQEAIIKGFQHKESQKVFAEYNPDNRPFTVLVTTEDEGLHASEFTVVWKNKRGLSVAQISKQAAAVKGKKPVIEKQGKSLQRIYLDEYYLERRKEREYAKAYWAEEKKKAQEKKPGIRQKLLKQIEQAEAKSPSKSRKKLTEKSGSTKEFLLSLDDGNQHETMLVPTVKLDSIVNILSTYSWARFDEYDNRLYEYESAFLTPLRQNRKLSPRELWAKLNRHQKVFYAIQTFTGQTDNGGVWQFLFNSPEMSLAALGAMHEIGVAKLAQDYQAVLEEFLGKGRTLLDLRKRFNDQKLSEAKRWEAFAEGYPELKSAEKIQKYFYTIKFKKELFKKLSDYIEHAYHQFAKFQTS